MTVAGCTEAARRVQPPPERPPMLRRRAHPAPLIMAVLIILVALTVVVAEAVAIVLFSIAPLALLAAVLPGSGRHLVWVWLGAVGRVVMAVVGMSFLLSLLLLTEQAMRAATRARPSCWGLSPCSPSGSSCRTSLKLTRWSSRPMEPQVTAGSFTTSWDSDHAGA
jgi:hypothetical protein